MLVSNLNKAQLWKQFGLSAAASQQNNPPVMISEAGITGGKGTWEIEGQQSLDLRREPHEPMTTISPRPSKANDVFNRLNADAKRKIEKNKQPEAFPQSAVPSQSRTPRKFGDTKIEDKLIQYGKTKEMKRLHDRALGQAQDMANLTSSPTISTLSKQIVSTPGSYTSMLEKFISRSPKNYSKTPVNMASKNWNASHLAVAAYRVKELLDIEKKEAEAEKKARLIKEENDRKQKEHQHQLEKLQGYLQAPPRCAPQKSCKEFDRANEKESRVTDHNRDTSSSRRIASFVQKHPDALKKNDEKKCSFRESSPSIQERKANPYRKNIDLPDHHNFSQKQFSIQSKTSKNQEEEKIQKQKMIEAMIRERKKQRQNPVDSVQPRYYESIEERIRQKAVQPPKSIEAPKPPTSNDRKKFSQMLDFHSSFQQQPASSISSQISLYSSTLVPSDTQQAKPPAPRQSRFSQSNKETENLNSSLDPRKGSVQSRRSSHQLDVAIRNELWLKRKNEKLELRQCEKNKSQLQGCTFAPDLKSKQHQFLHTSGMSNSSGYRGLSPENLSHSEVETLKFSNSYSRINQIKSRTRTRDFFNFDNVSSSGTKVQPSNCQYASLRSQPAF